MIFELLVLNGYGFYVWPAFIFSFLSIFYLYIKTKNDLKKVERLFLLEFNKKQYEIIQLSKKEKIKAEVFQTN